MCCCRFFLHPPVIICTTHSKTQWTCLLFFCSIIFSRSFMKRYVFSRAQVTLAVQYIFFCAFVYTENCLYRQTNGNRATYVWSAHTFIYPYLKWSDCFFFVAVFPYAVLPFIRSVGCYRSFIRSFLQPKIVAMLFGVPPLRLVGFILCVWEKLSSWMSKRRGNIHIIRIFFVLIRFFFLSFSTSMEFCMAMFIEQRRCASA